MLIGVKIMRKQQIKFNAYALRTPLLHGIDVKDNVIVPEFLKYFFLRLSASSKEIKIFNSIKNDIKKHMELESAELDQDRFIKGNFITYTYGVEESYENANTGEPTVTINNAEGKVNRVYFTLDLTTGLFLVQQDKEQIFKEKMFIDYFLDKKSIIMDIISKFNSQSDIPYNYTEGSTRNILFEKVMYPDFRDWVSEFSAINHVYIKYTLDEDIPGFINDAVSFVKDKNLLNFTDITLSVDNNEPKKHVQGVLDFIDAMDNDRVISVEGQYLEENKKINNRQEKGRRVFSRDIEVNENNVLRYSELLMEMEYVCRKHTNIVEINTEVQPVINGFKFR